MFRGFAFSGFDLANQGDEGDDDTNQPDDQSDELIVFFGESDERIHNYSSLKCKDNVFLIGLLYFCGKVTNDTII